MTPGRSLLLRTLLRAALAGALLSGFPGLPAFAGDGPRVASIAVEGLVRVDKGNIEKALPFKVGDEWTEEAGTDAVKAVYRLGPFSRVAVDAVPLGGEEGERAVAVTVTVSEFPLIRSIGFSGNTAVSTDDLKKALTMKVYGFFDPADYPRQVALIEKAYEGKGYQKVEVTPSSAAGPDGVRVSFAVEEGKKDLITEIDILGNRALSDWEVKAAMEIGEAGPLNFISDSGVLDRAKLAIDLDRIRLLYYGRGYLDVRVEEPVIRRAAGGGGIYVGIRVTEGDRFRLGKADFSGDWPSLAEAESLLSLRPGDPIERGPLVDSLKRMEDSVKNLGYARARVSPDLRPAGPEGLTDVTFSLVRGPLVRVRRIDITGNHKTRDYVIRQELRVQEGELYSQKRIDESLRQVRALGFLNSVEISPVPVEGPQGVEEGLVDLAVMVVEGSSGTLSAGLGYSSQDGFTGTLQHSQRNLFGRGQKLNIQVDKGSKTTNYNFSFTEPHVFTGDWSLGVDLFDTLKEYSTYTEARRGGGVRTGYHLTDSATLGFRYRSTRYDVRDVSPSASDYIQQQAGRSVTSAVRASLTLDTRDLPLDPREGYTLELSEEVAGGGLGGTNSFTRAQIEGAVFTPLAGDFVGSVHLLAGVVKGFEGEAVPLTERYFLGGLDSLRGFKYRGVGPLDEDGVGVGGSKLLQLNLEAAYPLVKEPVIKGVVFLDAGNVWPEGGRVDPGDLRYGAGLGFRWYSPMGLLRLEWGTNLSPRPGEEQPGWEFTIGASF